MELCDGCGQPHPDVNHDELIDLCPKCQDATKVMEIREEFKKETHIEGPEIPAGEIPIIPEEQLQKYKLAVVDAIDCLPERDLEALLMPTRRWLDVIAELAYLTVLFVEGGNSERQTD